jgi:uncharacterized surface anchored protein
MSCASSASGPVGSLTGIAVDNNGHVLPGITVSLQSEKGKIVQEVLTGEDGSYRFEDVPVGPYQVITTFAGFTAPKPLAVTVTSGATTNLPRLVLLPPQ